jgi:RimJ/RimL family protein N-acetyltransferase
MSHRLQLREFRDSDLDVLAAMVGDEDQMTFYPRPRTKDEAAAWIRRNHGFYAAHGFGSWLIEVLPRARFAGYCGIRPLQLDEVSEVEIGWHVHKRFWNQGIATEAAILACRAAATRFGLARLVALVHPDHVASRRVAENIGMGVERTTVLEDDYPALVYVAQLGALEQLEVLVEDGSAFGCRDAPQVFEGGAQAPRDLRLAGAHEADLLEGRSKT